MGKSERKKSSAVRKYTTCGTYNFKEFCKRNIEDRKGKKQRGKK